MAGRKPRAKQQSIEELLGPIEPGLAAGERHKDQHQELMRKLDPVHFKAVDKVDAYAQQCVHEEMDFDDAERAEYLNELLEGSTWERPITDLPLPDDGDTPL